NAALGTSFRRWWHSQIANFAPTGATLVVTVNNAGYTDVILPVWSLSTDGVNFGDYQRLPTSAVPTQPSGSSHRFTVNVPAGTAAIRLAKYFPYTTARKNTWLQSIASHPRLRTVQTLGYSVQGRPIEMLEFTDTSVADAGKRRIWIHAGIHPSESTSYFTVEGLVQWFASGDPLAEILLDRAIVDIVPMANPDGVFLGNYRTNANSSNLENEWAAPYNTSQPEVAALRTKIEQLMGTATAPASNPIDLLLNLHSSHNVAYPFHFRHTANAGWNPTTNNSGVLPIVNQIETQWINAFEQRSAFVNLGTTQSSSAGAPSRPFVESMMHDRWSALSTWTGAPSFQDPVMAITFEGTYGMGPNGQWNTEADYRGVGVAMGQAMADYFGLQPTASVTSYGAPCASLGLVGSVQRLANFSHQVNLVSAGGPANGLAAFVFGFQAALVPLPAPFANCWLQNTGDVVAYQLLDPLGFGAANFVLPVAAGLEVRAQVVSLAVGGSQATVDASNGVWVKNNY
ncbi:MAG: hypothetical protein RL398_1053, partial [Planctomycetota bacterium]